MTQKYRHGPIPSNFIKSSGIGSSIAEKVTAGPSAEYDNAGVDRENEKCLNSAIYDNEFFVKTIELGPGRVMLEYEGHMTVHYVRTILDELNYNLNKYSEMTVDLSGVNKIDSSAIQLMIIAVRDSLSKNKILNYINASPEVKKTFKAYGLSHYIEV